MNQQEQINGDEKLVLSEATFLLAAKRTYLAAVRTGLALLAVPLSVISFLIATSRYYHAGENIGFLGLVVIICLLLLPLGAYLVIRSLWRLHVTDKKLHGLGQLSPHLKEFVEKHPN